MKENMQFFIHSIARLPIKDASYFIHCEKKKEDVYRLIIIYGFIVLNVWTELQIKVITGTPMKWQILFISFNVKK